MTQGQYLPKQMNGVVINSYAQSLEDEFNEAEYICDYLYNLSISTADDDELDSIGRLIGYPRPLVPDGFNAENILILGTVPIQTDKENGLATVGQTVGGTLTSANATTNTYFMTSGLFRKFLERVAIIKRYGITINSIDGIASLINKNYTIKFDDNADIVLHYKDSIGYKNVWILTNLFYRFCTEPQVIVTSGGNE